MAVVVSPAGTKCTAEGVLLEKLTAAGWQLEGAKKPAPRSRKKASSSE